MSIRPEVRGYYLRELKTWRFDCEELHRMPLSFEAFQERRTALHVRYLALISNAELDDLADTTVGSELIAAAAAFFRASSSTLSQPSQKDSAHAAAH